jgi:arabinogalactan endo-1,4-beta-galactosidase
MVNGSMVPDPAAIAVIQSHPTWSDFLHPSRHDTLYDLQNCLNDIALHYNKDITIFDGIPTIYRR